VRQNRALQVFFAIIVLATIAFVVAFFFIKKTKTKVENPLDEISAAWLNFRMGEYNQAILKFQNVADGAPENSNERIQALYGLAYTEWLKQLPFGDKETASKLFNEIISKSPDSDYAAWSKLALARMKHIVPTGETPDYPVVRKMYQEIYDQYPKKTAGHEAFIYMIGTYLAAFTKEDAEFARKKLDEFIRDNPESPFISSAWGLLAKAYDILGMKEKKLDAMLKELDKREIDPKNPFMDNSSAYWAIASVAEFEVGDFDTARKYYKLMMQEYPRERRNFGATRALERMDALEAKLKAEN